MEGCELQQPTDDLRVTLMIADGPPDLARVLPRFILGPRRVERQGTITFLEAEIGVRENKRSTAKNSYLCRA